MAFEIDYILLDIGNSSFDVLYKDKTYKFDKIEEIYLIKKRTKIYE